MDPAMFVPEGFRSTFCSRGCFREVLVRDGDDRPAVCEKCNQAEVSRLGDAIRARKEEREKLIARKDEEHALRLARIRINAGNRTFKPGDRSGAKCPQCGRSYIYDEVMHQVHDGACPGSKGDARSPSHLAAVDVAGVRRTSAGYEEDDED